MGELAAAGLDGGGGGAAGAGRVAGHCAGAVVGRGAIQAARAEKARLQAEVAEVQAYREEWVKTGAQAKIERCGPKARPCVRVDEKAGVLGRASCLYGVLT